MPRQCIVPAILLMEEGLTPETAGRFAYLTTRYYPLLASLVAHNAPTTVLEIGTRFGYSLGVMMDACHSIERVVSVDSTNLSGNPYGGSPGTYERTARKLQALVQDGRYWPHVKSLTCLDVDTQVLDALPLPEFFPRFDLAYIDANHSTAGCLHDLELALPRMAPNAIIIVDDAHYAEKATAVPVWAEANGFSHITIDEDGNQGKLVLQRVAR